MKATTLTWSIAAATAMIIPALSVAQDGTVLEEVVVTGYRQSQINAIEAKRESTGFVDAVSAEDIGKLPDRNVAEALQRVPGVAIQRSRGEGDFVSIRGLGPDFVRGSINGRSFLSATEAVDAQFNGNLNTSAGRASNFDVLPSEIINTLQVIKTPSARHAEGGIAGVVNVQTARPLALGTKAVGTVQGTYRDFNEDFDPSGSVLGSWVNTDRTFGVLGSVAFSTRSLREDFSRHFGYFQSFGLTTPLDTDNDGVGDATPNDVPFPLSNNAEVYFEDRDRTTFFGTAQWYPGNETEVLFDVTYSERDVEINHQNLIFLPIASDADLLAAGQVVNDDGSVQVGNLLTNGVFTNIPSSLRPEVTTDLQNYNDELLSLGLNVEREIGSWTVTGDLSYAKAEGANSFDRIRIDGNNGTFAFNTTVGPNGFTIREAAGSSATSDPDVFVISLIEDRIATNEDEEVAFQLDGSLDIDRGIFSSFEVGFRARSREKRQARASALVNIGQDFPAVQTALPLSTTGFLTGASNFFDGDWDSSIDYNTLVFPDNGPIRRAVTGMGVSLPVPADPTGTFVVEEDTLAAYFQLNLDGEIGGLLFLGDVGVRIVNTDQAISGFVGELKLRDTGGMDTTKADSLSIGEADPISFDDNYARVLPSVNLRMELSENLYARFAASKTLTRPTFNDLAPGFSNINPNSSTNFNGDNFAVSLVAGNPGLKPYESTNFDIGLEWYFADASVLYASVFYKELDDYIATFTNTVVSELAGEPLRITGIEQDGSSSRIPADQLVQPDNQGIAELSGLELGYSHAFDNGFGFIINVTVVDNTAEFASTGASIAFPGVSDLSYNVTGFYESGRFQARLSYSYRDDYLLVASAVGFGGQIYAEEYGQLDAALSYRVFDNVSIFVEAVNLSDENQDQFTRLPNGLGDWFYSESHNGMRATVGVTASF